MKAKKLPWFTRISKVTMEELNPWLHKVTHGLSWMLWLFQQWELNIFPSSIYTFGKFVLHFNWLSHIFHSTDNDTLLGPLSGLCKVSQSTAPSVKEAGPLPFICSTPLPPLTDIPGIPAWDPLSRTPWQNQDESDETPPEAILYWLANEAFQMFKFNLKVHDPSKQYEGGIYHGKSAAFLSTIGGSVAKVAIKFKHLEIPFQYLLPTHPMTAEELIVPISSHLLRVVKYDNGQCVLKDKNKPLSQCKNQAPLMMQSDQLAMVMGIK